MFVMRTKCRLSDASADKPLWGLAGDVAAAALGSAVPVRDGAVAQVDAAEVLRLPDAIVGGAVVPRFLWAGGDVPALPAISAESWRWLEVMSGTPRVVAATAEQFVPQMVNLELVGGVNFKKGCYPGQEVVARSQYRGTLKRRATIVEGDALLQPGQEIFHSGDPGQPAGMVVLGGSLAAHRHAALVELKIAALQDGTLHAGSADGPVLRAAPLPYSMPAEAA
jgi:folate-binding protein YgfZ